METDRKTRVLVCDDNEDILELVTYLLEGEGFSVGPCSTGDRLLEEARSANPDLILLDLRLPGRDGIAVLEELGRLMTPAPPVIILSAQGGESERDRALRAGAAAFLGKPFSVDGLLYLVRRILKEG